MSITRRRLLKAAGLVSAAAMVPRLAPAGPILAPAGPIIGDAGLSRFACNVESWWTDLDFMDRFERAAEAGFRAIEFWSYERSDRDVGAIAAKCRSLGLDVIQFTGWGAPSLADTRNHAEFRRRMQTVVDVAEELDAPMFTIVGHQVVDGVDQAASVSNIERALTSVAPLLEAAGRTAILEPFNPVDHQGHFLNGSPDALAICRTIDSPAVKINWDLYHMQLTEGNLIASLRDGIDQVGYVQIADVPGRHQPGTGEINYTRVFAALDDMGYKGPVGLECWPQGGDAERAVADLVATVS